MRGVYVHCLLLVCFALASLLFSAGFFLTRIELPNTSTCDDEREPSQPAASCWLQPRYSKVGRLPLPLVTHA